MNGRSSARLRQPDPVQVRQLSRPARQVVGVRQQVTGVGQKEPRVKAAAAAGRRDRAKDIAEDGAVRAQGKAGFLFQLAQGGGNQGPGRRILRQTGMADISQRQRSGQVIVIIDGPARKDILRRHECRARSALPHKDAGRSACAARQDHGCGRADRVSHERGGAQSRASAWPIAGQPWPLSTAAAGTATAPRSPPKRPRPRSADRAGNG